MKELIEKIKAEEQFVYCFDSTVTDNEKKLRSEFNKGLHKAIKIIESYKPKVLDQPDSKGWWWVYDDIEEEWFPVFILVPGVVIVNINCDRWIKADMSIVPTKNQMN